MNVEALAVIGGFTLILGALLFALSRLFLRRNLPQRPEANANIKLTKVGVLCISALALVLIGGLLMHYIAPESALGQLVKTPIGRFSYAAVVALVFWLIELILNAKGIKIIEKVK